MHKDTVMESLAKRYGDDVGTTPEGAETALLASMAARGSCRAFAETPVSAATIRLLAAIALSAPSKSDLQQRDIIVIEDPGIRARLDALVTPQDWVRGAPSMLVFCGNNRRQRQIQDWRGHAFANDHLDAFFNAAVDAGIALSAFVTAAESVGLGCCPVSAIRNRAAGVSALLGLPDHVFPVAGLALGYPKSAQPEISMRLPLDVTLHKDRFDETGLREKITAYDRTREAAKPYAVQRDVGIYGKATEYGWSEDKARQYGQPERDDFGQFVRNKGFDLR